MNNEISGTVDFPHYSEMSDAEKKSLSSCKSIKSEYNDGRIQCVSLNEQGDIAVSTGRYINVYDDDGAYQYGYYVNLDRLNLISLHENYVEVCNYVFKCYFIIDRNGEVHNMKHITFDAENNRVYHTLYDQTHANHWDLNGYTYVSSGDKLVKVDEDGSETIIYQMSENSRSTEVSSSTIALVLLSIVILFFCITAI